MKSLKNFDFGTAGAKSTYDWEKLLDGGTYQVEKGVDFECETSTFTTLARSRAQVRSKNLKIKVLEDEITVVLRAEPMTPEQAATMQGKLAARKERAAAKKAEKKAGGQATEEAAPEADDAPPAAPAKGKRGKAA
jgi:hypothetical protein